MLFFSLFKTLVDQEVTVELKNGVELRGTLKSVDQFLNLKLDNLQPTTEIFTKQPHLLAIRNLFIRGSNIRYVYLNKKIIDTSLLQDAARREALSEKA
ncbi:U6 snRNA-associated Sm-like protein LSm2 [Hanseniaspora osmophila]